MNNKIVLECYDKILAWAKQYKIDEDCLQEIFLTLLENKKIQEIYELGQINGYICGLMHRMAT